MSRRTPLYKLLEVRMQRTKGKTIVVRQSPYAYMDYGRHLPKDGKPGRWTNRLPREPLVCRYGYHLTTAPRSLLRTLRQGSTFLFEVYLAEGRGEYRQGEGRGTKTKIAFQSIRLIKRMPHLEGPR